MATKVAFLGLGAMGVRMASNVLRAGYDLTVWNRNPDACAALVAAGAHTAATPESAVTDADFVITMLKDDAACRAVWLGEHGAAQAMKPGAVAIESSTVTPGWIAELAAALQARTIGLLDAPVSGSLPQAEKQTLVHLVGGDLATLDLARGILASMGAEIHHIGPVGRGITLKLAGNALLGIQIAAIAEQLAYLAKSGIDITTAGAVIASLSSASPATINAAKLIADQDFKPRFSIDLLIKDLTYATMDASRLGAPVPLAEVTHEIFRRASDLGLGALNTNAVSKIYLT